MPTRRADAIEAVSRLFCKITELAHQTDPFNAATPAEALQLMFIMSCIVVATKDGKPYNAHQIAATLRTPYSTVKRRLAVLQDSGRIKLLDHNYIVADWDFYDRLVTMDRIALWHDLVQDAADKLRAFRSSLAPEPPP